MSKVSGIYWRVIRFYEESVGSRLNCRSYARMLYETFIAFQVGDARIAHRFVIFQLSTRKKSETTMTPNYHPTRGQYKIQLTTHIPLTI